MANRFFKMEIYMRVCGRMIKWMEVVSISLTLVTLMKGSSRMAKSMGLGRCYFQSVEMSTMANGRMIKFKEKVNTYTSLKENYMRVTS